MRTLRRLAFLPLLPFLLLMVMAIPGEHSLSATAAATKNCSDFNSQAEAQSYFDKLGGSKTNNVDSLDADHDGIACEDLKHSGTVAKTVDAATGGGIGTGIAIGVVICLAVLIFWLYKRRPTSGVAFSTGTGFYSPSRLNTFSRPIVDSGNTEMAASLSSSMDPISAEDAPYSPENLAQRSKRSRHRTIHLVEPLGTSPQRTQRSRTKLQQFQKHRRIQWTCSQLTPRHLLCKLRLPACSSSP